jgi:uncharacterized LabA/DUF88 family protein/cold shock CspA family protein
MMNNQRRVAIYVDGGNFMSLTRYFKNSYLFGSYIQIPDFLEVITEYFYGDNTPIITSKKWFRGRMNAKVLEEKDQLKSEMIFSEMLARLRFVIHELPLKYVGNDKYIEKGIDTLLSVNALEEAYKDFYDDIILIANDADYVPLVEAIQRANKGIKIVHWELDHGSFVTKTSNEFINSTKSLNFMDEFDTDSSVISRILKTNKHFDFKEATVKITTLNKVNGYGFTSSLKSGKSIYLHRDNLNNFNELFEGDTVNVTYMKNPEDESKLVAYKIEN